MGFTIFNSEEKIYIVPPLSFGDAIKQRRRWVWGELAILNRKMLPLSNRLRLGVVGFSGLWLYSISILGLPLNYLGVFTIPPALIPFAFASLVLWFGMRAYVIGSYMGWKHGVAGALASYATVTLNFIVHLIGLAKGDPKKFEVIRKE
jgi:cellulose synthase/poly-beta-1,6-N-acetylglucosamine synthase-like glycosyltransferase